MTRRDPELDRRIREVLQRLRFISEAPASRAPDEDTPRGATGSRPPRGVRFERQGPPRKDDSLHDYWKWQFEQTTDWSRLHYLILFAERDLARAMRRGANYSHETEESRAKRILVSYAGWHPMEAALVEDVSEGFIRKVRRVNHLDPGTGMPREEKRAA